MAWTEEAVMLVYLILTAGLSILVTTVVQTWIDKHKAQDHTP